MLERLLRYPIALILGVLMLGIGGLASFRGLPVDLFPRLDYPLINIVTHYPAGTAEDMEQLITRPIENAMLGLSDLRRVRSTSAPGFSQVTVEFNWGLDVLQARQLVGSRLATVHLPDGARPELENIGTSLAMLSTYTLRGGDPVALRGWVQYQLAPRLSGLPGVARVEVMGGARSAWRIDVDPLALRRHHLTTAAIAQAIRRANVLDTGGHFEAHGRDLLVRTDARLSHLEDLRRVTVSHAADGRPIGLGDVARIYAGATPQRYVISSDGLPAVAFTIQKQPGASTLAVSQAVDAQLAATRLPGGVRLEKYYDQAEIIGLAYRNMRDNLLAGALLAIVAVLVILGRNRSSLVIAVTFPLTVLGAFWVMHLLGLGLNLMTLGALTVAIGMLADDAIVVLENIDRHRGLGESPWQAALKGTREILGADVAGTLTVLAAFAPLVIVGGLAGRLTHAFGITFSVLLLFSLLLSVTLIPLAAAHWMRPRSALQTSSPSKAGGLGGHLVRGFERFNLGLLDHLLRHRGKTLVVTTVLLLGSLALLAFNPARMLPLLDESSLLLSYGLAPGTSLDESNRVGRELEQRLLAIPMIEGVYRRTGSPGSSFYIEAPSEGELVLRLNKKKGADALAVKARVEQLLASLPGVIGRVNEPTSEKLDESFSGLPALFGITLYGNDLKTLYESAARVEQAATRVPGLANVVNNTKIPIDQLQVSVDRNALARFDVDAATLARTLRTALQGEVVDQVIIDQQPIDLFLRYADAWRQRTQDLQQIVVANNRGDLVPLGQLVNITQQSSYPTIEHQRGIRSLTLTAEIDGNP